MKNNPYIGPRPFERSDRTRFFGRARETRDLLSLIMAERVVLFYAQSGAGKTSLLNTQIIPALEEESFKVLPIARVGSDAPRGVEAASLKNIFVFSALLALAGPQGEISLLYPQTLKSFLASIIDDEHPPIVIFDQFEEILTTHRDRWEDARGFFEQLRDALQAIPKLGVVLAMREDHVAGLDPYANLLPKRLRTRFRMELLGYDGALEAVRKPAQNAGCAYGTGVAERLVDDLRRIQVTASSTGSSNGALGPYIEPVQLQVVCSRLWDNLPEREEHIITWPEIEQFGNIDRALTDFYESALQHTAQETSVIERQLRRWFATELITPMKTRGLALRGEHDTSGLPNAAVDVLDRQHLIRAESRAGAYWYELAHDRLVEPIVNSNAAYEQARLTSLRITAQEWQKSKSAGLLYGGSILVDAIRFTKTHPDDIEDYEREFLEASTQAQRIKARNRIIRLSVIAALSVGMIIMAALAALAFQSKQEADQQRAIAYEAKATAEAGQQEAEQQRQIAVTAQAKAIASADEAKAASARAEQSQAAAEQQSRLARAGQLAAQSQLTLNGFPQRSLLLALEALSTTQSTKEPITPAVWQALFDTLGVMGGQGAAVNSGPIVNMALGADGRWLATADENQHARLWDLQADRPAANPIELPGKIDRVTISPNGRWLATSGDDPAVRLWDLQSPTPVSAPITLTEQTFPANELIFSQDSRWLAASGNDSAIHMWDISAPDQPRAFEILLRDPAAGIALVPGERATFGLAISPDNRWLVSGGGALDSNLHLWDLTRANNAFTPSISLPYGNALIQSAYSPDQKWLATLNGDGLAQLWQITDVFKGRAQPIALNEPKSSFDLMTFSPDSRWLATGNRQGDVTLHPLADPQGPARHERVHYDRITSLSYSPNGHWLVATSAENTIGVWDVGSWGKTADTDVVQRLASSIPVRMLKGHENGVSASAISADSQMLVTASWDGTARRWDLSTTMTQAQPLIIIDPAVTITNYAVSGDSRWLATVTNGTTLTLHSLRSISDLLNAPLMLPAPASIAALAASPDGHWLATGSVDHLTRLYDLHSSNPGNSIELAGHTAEVGAVFFSPDSHWLLTDGPDNTLRLWDLSQAPGVVPQGHVLGTPGDTVLDATPLKAAVFSPDGRWLLTLDFDTAGTLWNLQSDKPVTAALTSDLPDGAAVKSAAFSFDNQWLLIGLADGSTRLWKMSASGPVSPAQVRQVSDGVIRTVAFSQGDRWAVAVPTVDVILDTTKLETYRGRAAAQVWNFHEPDAKPLALEQAPLVMASVLSPDGRWLAVASDAIRVWDLAAADPSTTAIVSSRIPGEGGQIAFSPDGHWMFSQGDQLRAWILQPDQLRALACQTVGRNFTLNEWRQYFPNQPYRATCDQWPLEDSRQ